MRKRHTRVVIKIGRLLRWPLRIAKNFFPRFLLVEFFYRLQALCFVGCLRAKHETEQHEYLEDRNVCSHSAWFGMARSVQLSVPCHAFSNSNRSICNSLPRSGSFMSTAVSCGLTPTITA